MGRSGFVRPLFVIALGIAILTMFLPCSFVTAELDGKKETFYSSAISSVVGPIAIALFIIAMILIIKRMSVPSVILALIGAGLDLYGLLNKLSETEQRVISKGYTIISSRQEYGLWMGFLGLFIVGIAGAFVLIDREKN